MVKPIATLQIKQWYRVAILVGHIKLSKSTCTQQLQHLQASHQIIKQSIIFSFSGRHHGMHAGRQAGSCCMGYREILPPGQSYIHSNHKQNPATTDPSNVYVCNQKQFSRLQITYLPQNVLQACIQRIPLRRGRGIKSGSNFCQPQVVNVGGRLCASQAFAVESQGLSLNIILP